MKETILMVKEGERITLPPSPSKEGYVFKGWFYDEEGKEPFDGTKKVDSDLRLYAMYEVDDVILISDVESFLSMRNDGHYRLKSSLDFKGRKIAPIGTYENPFSGTFDGNGFTISNFQVENGKFCSLFGYVTGTIKNVRVNADMMIKAESTCYASPLISYLSFGTVINCTSSGVYNITSSSMIEGSYFGGIVARSEYGKIENCFSSVSVSNNSKGSTYTGGIVGYQGSSDTETASIKNCYFDQGTLQSSATEDTGSVYLGGVVGYSFGVVENCFSVTGTIQGRVSSYQGFVGGVVADNNGGEVRNCFSSVDVSIVSTSGNTFRGAVCGRNFKSVLKENNGTMENCFGFEGQMVSCSSEETIKSRHLKQNVPLVTLENVSKASWYKEVLGYSSFLIKDGYYPCYQSEFRRISTDLRKGTPGNPISVSSVDDLKGIQMNQSYRLEADISLKGIYWNPLGTYTSPFFGSFDGNNHSITDISVSQKGFNSLFGYVNGIIKNLKTTYSIDDICDSDMVQYYGGIASFAEKSYIDNCYSKSEIDATAKGIIAGGLIGYSEESIISRCYSDSIIKMNSLTPSSYAGGLLGINQNGSVLSSRSESEITSSSETISSIGGLIGKNEGKAEKTYSLGKLVVEQGETIHLGGIAGQNKEGKIKDSYSFMEFDKKMNASMLLEGGICGLNTGRVSNVYYHNKSVRYSFGSSVVDSDVHNMNEDEIRNLQALYDYGFYHDEESNLTRLISERKAV